MTDAELLADLADLLERLDPVPPRVRVAAHLAGAFVGAWWDQLDVEPMAAVAVRGESQLWRSSVGVVDIGDRVSGLLTTPVDRVELHSGDGLRTLPIDAVGGFATTRPAGRVRLVVYRVDGTPLVSGWFE